MRSMFVSLALLLGLSACGDSPSASPEQRQTATPTRTGTPTQSPTPLSIPLEEGPPLEPGTYLVSKAGRQGSDPLQWSIVDYTIRIPAGWNGHTGHYLSKYEDVEGKAGLGIYPLLVDEIYADACEGERGPTVAVGPEPDDLVDALLSQPGPLAGKPVATTIGGRAATRIDLKAPALAGLKSCHMADYGPPALQIWFSRPSDKYFVLMPGDRASVYVVDVDGERQVFLAVHGAGATDADSRELQSMLDSIEFLP